MNRFFSLLLCTSLSLALNGVLPAQERDTTYNLPIITITPTNVTERSSPVTFSNLSRKELQERYSQQDVPTLLSELPSITTYSENGNGIGYNYITLRGFDQRRLSIMVNGVPQNDPEDHNVYWIDFPDVLASTDNIQVQRGAGNAFYGPAAIGGSVNLTTTPFTLKQNFLIESSIDMQQLGNAGDISLNSKRYAFGYNSGMVEGKYLFYGKLSRMESSGYREHSYATLGSYYVAGARFDENMTTRVQFYGGPIDDALAYYGLPKFVNGDEKLRRWNPSENLYSVDSTGRNFSYFAHRRSDEVEHFSQPHLEVMNDWKISPTTTLHNTLFYIQGDGYFDYDGSWADTSYLRLGYNYGIPVNQNPTNTLIRAYVGNKQFGWLPRIEMEHDNGTLIAGAELRFHRSFHWGKIQTAGSLPSNFNYGYHFYEYNGGKDIASLYAHELHRIDDKTSVMGDVQFVYNNYKIYNEKYLKNDFTVPYYFINPKLGINYNFNTESNVYTSLAYTTREPRLRNLYAAEDSYFGATPQFKIKGIVNGTPQYDYSSPFAKPERLLNWEFGTSYKNATESFRINFYWMEFFDELVNSGQLDIFGQPVAGNAERTRHIGIEYDATKRLSDYFNLAGNITFSSNRLIHYTTFENGVNDKLDGNPIAGFPDVLGNLRLTYRNGEFTSSLLSKYVGSFYTDNYKLEGNKNDDFLIFNVEALYTVKNFSNTDVQLRFEARNILNKYYFMSGQGSAFFPAAERNYLFGVSVHI